MNPDTDLPPTSGTAKWRCDSQLRGLHRHRRAFLHQAQMFCTKFLGEFPKRRMANEHGLVPLRSLGNHQHRIIELILHIYDINCQYCIHLRERIESNDLLNIPDHIEILHAIGLFHVHGHKDECLYRWATN